MNHDANNTTGLSDAERLQMTLKVKDFVETAIGNSLATLAGIRFGLTIETCRHRQDVPCEELDEIATAIKTEVGKVREQLDEAVCSEMTTATADTPSERSRVMHNAIRRMCLKTADDLRDACIANPPRPPVA